MSLNTVTSTVSIGAESAQMLAANVLRVGVIFLPQPGVSYTVSTVSPVKLFQGINVIQGMQPVEFSLERHGLVVKSAWYAVSAPPTTVQVLEIFP